MWGREKRKKKVRERVEMREVNARNRTGTEHGKEKMAVAMGLLLLLLRAMFV